MQTLSAGQEAVLRAGAVTVDFGAELLRPDLTLVEDVSVDVVGAQVQRNMNAAVHGTCRLRLSRELRWGVDLIRLFMLLADADRGTVERFDCGVFVLTTPQREVGDDVVTFEVSGFDRLHLLQRQVGADYTVAVDVTYRQALLDTFTAAGLTGVLIDGVAADDRLPTTRTWPLIGQSPDPDQTATPVTWLRVVNDLLRAINFRAVWADETGRFRCQDYQQPAVRPVEWTFDADELLTLVGQERTVVEDVWATPNRWVFRWTNAPAGTLTADLTYTVDNLADGPTSQTARGLVWPSVIDYEAASRAKLVSLGNRRVALDRRVERRLKYTTSVFPAAGHADIFMLRDAAAGVMAKVQAAAWSFDLSGSDVEWDWEVVT